ncbi:hypothetical protein RRG08_043709 [Elysia crispata]|uniref:Uncharacterized protein n=1 Tax=Elysia crispata TaxID=231223 RepID=A0AAE0ZN48_9GAST|nr:hypothetical protein RRG08_043709 [Elysia crispata]
MTASDALILLILSTVSALCSVSINCMLTLSCMIQDSFSEVNYWSKSLPDPEIGSTNIYCDCGEGLVVGLDTNDDFYINVQVFTIAGMGPLSEEGDGGTYIFLVCSAADLPRVRAGDLFSWKLRVCVLAECHHWAVGGASRRIQASVVAPCGQHPHRQRHCDPRRVDLRRDPGPAEGRGLLAQGPGLQRCGRRQEKSHCLLHARRASENQSGNVRTDEQITSTGTVFQ